MLSTHRNVWQQQCNEEDKVAAENRNSSSDEYAIASSSSSSSSSNDSISKANYSHYFYQHCDLYNSLIQPQEQHQRQSNFDGNINHGLDIEILYYNRI